MQVLGAKRILYNEKGELQITEYTVLKFEFFLNVRYKCSSCNEK